MGDSPQSTPVHSTTELPLTERLAARLLSEGEKTAAFFQDLTPEQWNTPIYETGSCWTIGQILSHFVSTEQAFADLIANILDNGPGAPENFDIDEYNERHVARLEGVQVNELLMQYLNNRGENVRLVQAMRPRDLQRQGRHPFLGIVSLEEIVKLLYRHNQIHLRDVRRALNSPPE